MRVAAHGLPLVCVNPAICLGAGDHLLSSTRLVRSFLLGRIPVYTDGAVGIVDVRDAAAGHLLADVRGDVGERYLLSAAGTSPSSGCSPTSAGCRASRRRCGSRRAPRRRWPRWWARAAAPGR